LQVWGCSFPPSHWGLDLSKWESAQKCSKCVRNMSWASANLASLFDGQSCYDPDHDSTRVCSRVYVHNYTCSLIRPLAGTRVPCCCHNGHGMPRICSLDSHARMLSDSEIHQLDCLHMRCLLVCAIDVELAKLEHWGTH
jgi:hypothetical protein